MSILLIKSVLTTVVLVLAGTQALTMAQVRGYIRILPGSKERLRATHRLCGGTALLLLVVIAVLCLITESYPGHVPIHVLLGTLAILVLATKVAIALRFRSELRYALALGSVAGLSVLGTFLTSALPYFISGG